MSVKLEQDQVNQIYAALQHARPYVKTCTEQNGQDRASRALSEIDNALAWFSVGDDKRAAG